MFTKCTLICFVSVLHAKDTTATMGRSEREGMQEDIVRGGRLGRMIDRAELAETTDRYATRKECAVAGGHFLKGRALALALALGWIVTRPKVAKTPEIEKHQEIMKNRM